MPKNIDYGLPDQADIGLTGFGPERESEDFLASYALRNGMSRAEAREYAEFMRKEQEKTLLANMKLAHRHANMSDIEKAKMLGPTTGSNFMEGAYKQYMLNADQEDLAFSEPPLSDIAKAKNEADYQRALMLANRLRGN